MMQVAKSLGPGWFDKIALNVSVPRDIKALPTFVAEDGGRTLGFITYSKEGDKGDIKWIGVDPRFHRQGIGSKLYAVVEEILKREGVREVRVETVSVLTEYEPYERTRAFYEKMGFRVEKVEKTTSEETGEGFHLATYLKVLH